MKTYKYDSVNAVVFKSDGSVTIETRDHHHQFTTVVKGTWSLRGTKFRVVSMVKPKTVRYTSTFGLITD
jgi:hypothetical protein